MKKIVYLILALLLCIPLTGCGGKLNESLLKSDSVPLIIIAGKHANMNFFTEIPETLSKLINDSMTVSDTGNGYQCKADVSIIINDGAPATLDLNFDLTETTNEYNENYLNANVESIKNNIQRVLLSNKVIADDEESDLLTALHEASFIAKGQPANLYIYDSGYTTSGYLNMNSSAYDIANNDVESIISQLSSKNAIPSLENISVYFEGLGNVAGAQNSYEEYSSNLTDLWKGILSYANAASANVQYSNINGTAMVYDEDQKSDVNYPYVTPISFHVPSTEVLAHVYNSAQLGFKSNSADFKDGVDLAKKAIQDTQLESLLKFVNSEDGTIYVVGSIAKTSPDSNEKTSQISANRAQVVKELLIELGIPSTRIQTIDAGVTTFTWRNSDEFPDGKKNTTNQQNNRVVAIIPDSESCASEVQELKNAGYIE